MLRDQNTAIENARASISRDLEKHLAAAQVLRHQLNCLTPISSLPPEIMVNIFFFVRDASLHPLHCIKVTHVCTYWRQVAIHAPSLWCRPPLANLPWTVEMLARSKQVDITLEFDSQKYYTGQFKGYREAFKHAARIRRISLDFSALTSGEELNSAMGNLPISAPRLETLLIDIPSSFEDYSIPGDALVNAPNLRRLELTYCTPNWDAHWLPQITHLMIYHIPNPDQLTWTCLITALGKMQNLESLVLFHSIPSDTVTSDVLDQTLFMNINLGQLRVLCIWDEFLAVGTFFRYITFPPEAAVHVTLVFSDFAVSTELEAEAVRLPIILRDIGKSYSNAASSNILFSTLVLDYSECVDPTLCFGMFDGKFEETADRFEQPFDLSWVLKNPRRGLSLGFQTFMEYDSASWIKNIFPGIFSAGFPLYNISHAHLRTRIPLEKHSEYPRLLAETLGVLPALSFIKISMLAGPWILRTAVYHASEDANNPMLSLMAFPRLESIQFHEVPFLPSNTKRRKALGFVDRKLLQQFLLAHSATVRRCQLEGCFNLTTADVDKLRKVVGDVVCWDGVELDEHDYEDYSAMHDY